MVSRVKQRADAFLSIRLERSVLLVYAWDRAWEKGGLLVISR